MIAGSEQRCLGGVKHLCLSSGLPGAGARGFFPCQNRASRSPSPKPLSPLGRPAWPSVMLDRGVQQITEDNGPAGLDVLKVSPF